MMVVVMGVCGCGKTTVGQAVADALGWHFLDADAFHPPENVAKMAAGTPLTDEDRWPWLDRLRDELRAIDARGESVVLACSALRSAYRRRLAQAGDVRFVYLKGDRATIAPRLVARAGHYMPASLLDSQFAVLEEPTDAITIDAAAPLGTQISEVCRALAPDAIDS
jgi:gluconokinase